MTTSYTSPELIRYGAVEALTASAIKCTPGGDFLGAHGHELDGGGAFDPPLHVGEQIGGTNDHNCSELQTLNSDDG